MHRPPAPLPEPLGPVFTYREAIALGVTSGRLRHRSLTTPTPGVRVAEGEVDVRARAAAIAQLLPPGSAFSHHTAAALLGLPVPDDDRLHVTVPDGMRMRRQGVVEHRGMQRREVGYVDDIPTTSPAQTWMDLAASLSLEELIILGDAIMHSCPEHGVLLRSMVVDNPGARGIRRAREAVELIRPGVRSPQETLWRLRFRAAGFTEPKLNEDVRDRNERWLGMADFVWRDQRVVVEYDGDYHFTVEQRRLDQARRRAMRDADWNVIEINGTDNHDPTPAMRTIGRALGH
ncbi:hypothetical protein [Flexivirga alba]|uniref:DUF559 domain-containing protein n=1 Tax=Flexivirga alba TaxID=702742 RepID=A0ABW2AGK5_9MICO